MKIDWGNTSIHYEILGEGRPVLMIHGWGVDHRLMKGSFEEVFSRLDAPWKRIYLDLPGMGESPGEPWIKDSNVVLEILKDFIERAIPGENFLLAGESYGGYLACGLIGELAHRIDGVMLLCPNLIPGDRKGDLAEFQVLEQDQELLEELTPQEREMFQYMTVCQTRQVWKSYKRDILPGILLADQSYLENTLDGAFQDRDTLLDKPFEKPSLILAGKQDGEVGFKDQFKLLEYFPRGSYGVLDMAGHNLQIERFSLFEAHVKDWLKRVAG